MANEVFVQFCGAAAAVLLILMLIPQVVQIYRTRHAEELSHVFLATMNFGLVMLTVYNIFYDLWVFLVAGLMQLTLGFITQAGKCWADSYQRRLRAKTSGGLDRALSLRSGAKLELARFAAGQGGFGAGVPSLPQLRPSPAHLAQHLLMDAQLGEAASVGAMATAGAQTAEQLGKAGSQASFEAVAEMLEGALASAGLLARRGQLAANDAATSPEGDAPGQMAEGEAEGGAETRVFECHDGYAALVWHGDTGSLSVDCLAVTAQSMRGMSAAAESFSAALSERYPGCKVAASSVGRLPAAAAA